MSLTHPLQVHPRSASVLNEPAVHDRFFDPDSDTVQVATSSAVPTYPALPELTSPTPAGLARLASVLATRSDLWRPVLHFDPVDRWYTRVAGGEGWEAWLLTWLPGQRTGLHDHGGSAGAFTVLSGVVREESEHDAEGRLLLSRDIRHFGSDHIHDVIGDGDGPAATLHVYAPTLTIMRRYERETSGGIRLVSIEQEGADW